MDISMGKPMPLRAVYPSLYDVLVAKLEEEHLHAYDVKSVLIRDELQVSISIFSGDNFERRVEGVFQPEQIDVLDESVIELIEQAVQACKKSVEADYRIFMKVQP